MQKKFGQKFEDAVYGGLQSIVQNPKVRETASNIKEGFFNLYDPIAAKTTEIGLPLLQTLTPEIYYDKATREKMVEGIEPYKPNPEGMSNMERLGRLFDEAKAEFGAFGQTLFGEARNASEKLNQGIAFEDLSPEEQAGARMFGFDVATAMIPGGIFSKPAVKGATALGTDLIKPGGFKASAGGPPTDVIKKLNTAKPEISKEELAALSRFYYGLTPSSLPQNQLRATIIQADPAIFSRMEKDRRNYLEKARKYGVDDEGNPLNPGSGPKTGVPRTTKKSLLNNEKRKAIEEVLTPVWNAAKKRNGNAVLPKEWKNQYLPAINEKYPKLFADDPLTANKMSQLLGGYSTPAGKTRSSKLIDKVINEGSVSSRGSALDKQVAKLTSKPDAGGLVPTIARSVGKDLQDASRFDEFFTSQGIDLKKLRSSEFDQKTFTRDYLQTVFRGDETLQKYLKDQPYNYNEKRGYIDITLNRSHVDRSIAAGDDVTKQFQGMDAGDIKILGATVNNVLQKDLERSLVNYIKNKDVKNSKRIIGEMNDFFIGTKLNDPSPNFPKLNADDYKWLDKNKVVKIPTISVGAGRPFKNTDAVLFGTREQPSASEILKGELVARQLNAAKRAYKREEGNVTDFYKLLNQGGLVGDMVPIKANVGKFIKGLFGETPSYRKEGMDVTDLFGPTKKQKQTLEQLYPGKSFPETYPGEVFYSNFDLALSRRGAPESFQNEDSFRNYMNQSGVGTDELDDAKVIPYIKSKSQGGEQIFSQDLRRIANQSPIRSVFMDAYGFRSDKINQASRDIFDPNTGSRVQVEGQAVFKNPAYSGTAIMDGELANTYRERVFRVKKDKLRGDPGSVPGGADNHKFGGTPDTEGNYTLFWTRQTDRPAYIIPGEVVDKKTGDIISPAMLSDQTKLKGIEDRIQKLFADPIATLNPEDLEGVSATVKRLVDSSAGRLTSGKAYNVVMGQIDAKQKQIKRLQNEYTVEKERLDSFVSPQKKEIVTTMIDELQSDILQSLRTKSRNLAGKLKIMADRNMSIDSMRDKELLEYFQDTGGVVRPLGKTKEELLDQFNQLKEINKQLKESSQKFAFGITEGDLNYYNNVKQMQQQIINEMTNNISKDLMQKLYPDVPFKDRIQYADAAVKQSVAEAAHRLFIEKDPNAPKYISYMSGAQIKSNYNQPGGAATPAAERSADLDTRQRMFEQSFAGGNEGAVLEQSELRGIGTEEFYGGPDVKNEQGAHFTGVMENIFKKIANEYGSKMEIANVATQNPRVRDVYNIIDQDTGVVMGSGDTYRQAENIANDLVEEGGGRYRIATETERVYDSRPVFTMEITPEMLQLFKAYK